VLPHKGPGPLRRARGLRKLALKAAGGPVGGDDQVLLDGPAGRHLLEAALLLIHGAHVSHHEPRPLQGDLDGVPHRVARVMELDRHPAPRLERLVELAKAGLHQPPVLVQPLALGPVFDGLRPVIGIDAQPGFPQKVQLRVHQIPAERGIDKDVVRRPDRRKRSVRRRFGVYQPVALTPDGAGLRGPNQAFNLARKPRYCVPFPCQRSDIECSAQQHVREGTPGAETLQLRKSLEDSSERMQCPRLAFAASCNRRQHPQVPPRVKVVHMREPDVVVTPRLVALRHAVRGVPVGDVAGLDALDQRQVLRVRRLLIAMPAHRIVDQHRHLPGLANGLPQRPIRHHLPGPLQAHGAAALARALGQRGATARAGELGEHRAALVVHRLPPEHDLAAALGAQVHVRPDGIVDAPLDAVGGIAVRVPGLVHPAALGLHLAQDALRLPPEGGRIHRRVIVIGDKGRRGREVVEHRPAGAQQPDASLALKHLIAAHGIAQLAHRIRVAAELRGHPRHPGAAETVIDDIPRVGIVQDIAHDGLVGHLGVVRVGVVDGMVLALGDIRRIGLAVVAVAILSAVGLLRQPQLLAQGGALGYPALQDLGQKGVGAGGIVRRVRERQDGLIAAQRKALRGPEIGILEILGQALAIAFPGLGAQIIARARRLLLSQAQVSLPIGM